MLIIETYTLTYHIFKISQFIIYKFITPSNIIYNLIIFNILHFLQTLSLDSLIFTCFIYSKD